MGKLFWGKELSCFYRNFTDIGQFVFVDSGPESAMEAFRRGSEQSRESIPFQGAQEAFDAALSKGREMALRGDDRLAVLPRPEPRAPGDGSGDAISASPERTRWSSDIRTYKVQGQITPGRYSIEEGKSDVRFRAADGSVITHLDAGRELDIQDGTKYNVGGVTFVKATYTR